jgi:hypothetical protein
MCVLAHTRRELITVAVKELPESESGTHYTNLKPRDETVEMTEKPTSSRGFGLKERMIESQFDGWGLVGKCQ